MMLLMARTVEGIRTIPGIWGACSDRGGTLDLLCSRHVLQPIESFPQALKLNLKFDIGRDE